MRDWEETFPLLYVLFIVAVHGSLFFASYVLPGLQVDLTVAHLDTRRLLVASAGTLAVLAASAMFFWSFLEVYRTPPGFVPRTREWTKQPDLTKLYERSRDGDIRRCKHEGVYSEWFCRTTQNPIARTFASRCNEMFSSLIITVLGC